MSGANGDFSLELAARPRSVALARSKLLSWLAHRAEVPSRSTGAIALALSEAVANSVRHAYPGSEGRVRVAAQLRPGRLEVLVADAGGGFREHPAGAGGGLGMAIIGRLTDEVAMRSSANGTEVVMRFDLAPPRGRERRRPPNAERARGPELRRLDAATR